VQNSGNTPDWFGNNWLFAVILGVPVILMSLPLAIEIFKHLRQKTKDRCNARDKIENK